MKSGFSAGMKDVYKRQVQKGLSLVIVNTAKGQLIFENIKECLFEEERSLDEAVMGNKNLVESSQRLSLIHISRVESGC